MSIYWESLTLEATRHLLTGAKYQRYRRSRRRIPKKFQPPRAGTSYFVVRRRPENAVGVAAYPCIAIDVTDCKAFRADVRKGRGAVIALFVIPTKEIAHLRNY
jgi:hypothetical protein